MVQGRPAPAVSLVHVCSVLQKEFTDNQGALGSRGQFRLTWEVAPRWSPGGYEGSSPSSHKESPADASVPRSPPPRLLTPTTACTKGVLPSSSVSAQLTSAPCARAVASAGRSRVRAARCARSPGCSSRRSARPQASASPSASPLESSDSAPSTGRGGLRSGAATWPGVGLGAGGGWAAAEAGRRAPTLLGDAVHHGACAEGQHVRAAVRAAP